MPDIVKKVYGYHVYFWSNEGDPPEPVHFHISKVPHKNATKYWVLKNGTIKQDNNNDNIPQNDLARIERYMSLELNIIKIVEKWKEHFESIKYIN